MKNLLLAIGLTFAQFAHSGDLFVKSLKAPLLKEAKISSEVLSNLERGDKVSAGAAEGAFIQVLVSGKKGYVNKLFLSDKPLAEKNSILDKDVDISSKARKRASGFTSAAAARGLKEDSDQIFKTLGAEANPAEFKKMQTFLIKDQEGLDFIQDDKKEIKQ